MKDKEKQVEEITKVIKDNAWEDIKEIEARVCAEAIYEQSYRKIDKDSVVISKEEYSELVKENKELGKQCLDWMELYHKQLNKTKEKRQKTTEKIITKIKRFLSNVETVAEKDEYSLYPEIGYKCSEVDDFLDKLEKEEVNL